MKSKSAENTNTLNLPPETKRVLQLLASESETTLTDLVSKLIKDEDQERHVVWNRKAQAFVRIFCGLGTCPETDHVETSDGAD